MEPQSGRRCASLPVGNLQSFTHIVPLFWTYAGTTTNCVYPRLDDASSGISKVGPTPCTSLKRTLTLSPCCRLGRVHNASSTLYFKSSSALHIPQVVSMHHYMQHANGAGRRNLPRRPGTVRGSPVVPSPRFMTCSPRRPSNVPPSTCTSNQPLQRVYN